MLLSWSSFNAQEASSVTVNARLTHFYQGSSDDDIGYENGGKFEIGVNLNLDQLGWWQGATLTVNGEANYGETVNNRGNILMPVNMGMLFPGTDGSDRYDITNFYFTKRVGSTSALLFGKINMFDFVIRRGSGGAGIDYYQNMALVAPPTGLVPPHIFGALYTGRTGSMNYTFAVYDPISATNKSGLENPFEEGVSTFASFDFPTTVSGKTASHTIKFAYSTMDGADLEEVFLPPFGNDIAKKTDRYHIAYTYRQFIVENPSLPDGGWGLFATVGASDGNPSNLDAQLIVGLGGNSLTRARPTDRWGVGYYRYSVSDPIEDGLADLGLPLQKESAIEAFYNIELSDSLNLSADVQYIDPVIKSEKKHTVMGLRLSYRF